MVSTKRAQICFHARLSTVALSTKFFHPRSCILANCLPPCALHALRGEKNPVFDFGRCCSESGVQCPSLGDFCLLQHVLATQPIHPQTHPFKTPHPKLFSDLGQLLSYLLLYTQTKKLKIMKNKNQPIGPFFQRTRSPGQPQLR